MVQTVPSEATASAHISWAAARLRRRARRAACPAAAPRRPQMRPRRRGTCQGRSGRRRRRRHGRRGAAPAHGHGDLRRPSQGRRAAPARATAPRALFGSRPARRRARPAPPQSHKLHAITHMTKSFIALLLVQPACRAVRAGWGSGCARELMQLPQQSQQPQWRCAGSTQACASAAASAPAAAARLRRRPRADLPPPPRAARCRR